jgi:hypothetical protein
VFDPVPRPHLQHHSAEVLFAAALLAVVHHTTASPWSERLGLGSPLWHPGAEAQSIVAARLCFGIAAGVPPMCHLVSVYIVGWVHWVRMGFVFGKR